MACRWNWIPGCLYLFYSLPVTTKTYFLLWNLIGVVVYVVYGSRQAERARASVAGDKSNGSFAGPR